MRNTDEIRFLFIVWSNAIARITHVGRIYPRNEEENRENEENEINNAEGKGHSLSDMMYTRIAEREASARARARARARWTYYTNDRGDRDLGSGGFSVQSDTASLAGRSKQLDKRNGEPRGRF